jgi:OCT family organic cation transporter-like MFS transporter 4/5
MMFTLGEFVLVGLAWALRHWRNLTLAAGLITAAGLLLLPFVPESARWVHCLPSLESSVCLQRS